MFLKNLLRLATVLLFSHLSAQVKVQVNLDVKHEVGGISTFDRSKFITFHGDQVENEWDGNNFTEDLRNDFLIGYDVYLGRNTGGVSYVLRSLVDEDPARPGYADPAHMKTLGASSRANYANKTGIHQYESRNNLILGGQLTTFWPDGKETNKGWALSQADTETEPIGTATGEYMGHYIKEFFGDDGQPRPEYIEVVNEPLFYLEEYNKVFLYHNSVAHEIRKLNPDVKIGGYTVAFPNFEENNFGRWHERDKSFIDIAGENMDFWSWHLYDFSAWAGGKKRLRSGSNVEASFDMHNQYSMLKLGHTKPYVISEYGGVAHDYKDDAWSAYRDWLQNKSVTPLMLSLMERPDEMILTIPFNLIKAEWSNETAYNHRLMIRESEKNGGTSDKWIYSDHIQFYELWKEVKGTRVDSYQTDLDVMVDAYVDGTKVYVILSNLHFEDTPVDLALLGLGSSMVSSIRMKHNYLNDAGDAGLLEDKMLDATTTQVTLKPEATMILEYTLDQSVAIDQTSKETKYYSDTYLEPIVANAVKTFNINGVALGNHGEATLRLGLGRNHDKSLQPIVKVNGKIVTVPADFRGYDQKERPTFFGVIEIPVPYSFLQTDNQITVEFPDQGGHISSVTMQVFEFSKSIKRFAVASVSIDQEAITIASGKTRQLQAIIEPADATNKVVTWSSDQASVATVDQTGLVSAVAEGTATITVTTDEKDDNGQPFTATCVVTVDDDFVLKVGSIEIKPATLELGVGAKEQLEAVVSPAEAENKAVNWVSENAAIATVDASGMVTAVALGSTTITATAQDGSGVSQSMNITVVDPAFVRFDDVSKYKSGSYESGTSIEVTCNYSAGGGTTVSDDGIKFWLREITPNFAAVVKDYTSVVTSVAGSSSGTATTTISLEGVPPTENLPEGNFYFLFVNFKTADGQVYDHGIFPINITPGAKVDVTSISINPSSISLEVDATKSLTVSFAPANATDKAVTWTSSDVSIATVSNSGSVVGIAEGTATITAMANDGGFEAQATITVTPKTIAVTGVNLDMETLTLRVDQTEILTASVLPAEASNDKVQWTSSNQSVATVDASGLVTAVSEGDALITATTEDGGFEAVCSVSVLNNLLHASKAAQSFIYPNPVSNMLLVDKMRKVNRIEIIDMLGNAVKQAEPDRGQIDITDVVEGVYFIRIYHEGGLSVDKLLVKR
ncbi:MAG: Ig-like domain-containing protein [Cyclobacteriaceae bacterium]